MIWKQLFRMFLRGVNLNFFTRMYVDIIWQKYKSYHSMIDSMNRAILPHQFVLCHVPLHICNPLRFVRSISQLCHPQHRLWILSEGLRTGRRSLQPTVSPTRRLLSNRNWFNYSRVVPRPARDSDVRRSVHSKPHQEEVCQSNKRLPLEANVW